MQTEIRFKIGDVVLLKSGGPKMTKSQIKDKDDRNIIQTIWFAGNKIEHWDFRPETLTFSTDKRPLDFSKLTSDERA